MERRSFLTTALALALPARALAQSPISLRIATDPFDAYAEPYYAKELGLFTKAGFDVDVQTYANGAAIASALAGGYADIGISNPISLASAIEHGVPFTLIAGGGMYSAKAPTTVLCVAKDSKLRSPRELGGKTISISALKSTDEGALGEWLGRFGVAISTVRIIELPFSSMGAALERGTVDAAMIAEPALESALVSGQARTFGTPFDAIAPRFLIGAWFTTTTYARANPAIVARFVRTIYEAGRWANANQNESAQILNKYTKIPLAST